MNVKWRTGRKRTQPARMGSGQSKSAPGAVDGIAPGTAGMELSARTDRLVAVPVDAQSSLGEPQVPSVLLEPVEASAPAAAGQASGERQVVTSAAVITSGTLLGSVLGLVRSELVNALFYGGASGAFTTALRPVQQVSDLLVGGSVSGALIPTFVDYSAPERRDELRYISCTVANLVAILMIVSLVGLALAAPYFVPLEVHNFSAADKRLTVQLVQIAAFSLLGLGLYGVGSALLYALKVVVYPAFAPAMYHLGVMLCGTLVLLYALHRAGVPLGEALHSVTFNPAVSQAREIGARGLAVGAAVGAMGEVVLLLPGLRRIIQYWRPVLDLRHPAVRQILRLYAPLAVGLIISVAAQNLDVTLLGLTPGGSEKNVTSMMNGAQLIQFPVGLVSAALSFSVLPLLVRASNAEDTAGFKRTLVLGFRLGLLLMVPAMVGMLVLGRPIMALLFQHGLCDSGCTYRNVLTVRNMAYQLPFLAIDQILIAAYYARKNTIVPMIVGIVSIGAYAAIAVPFAQTIGLPSIAFANAMQNSSHAIILFVLLTFTIGDLGMRQLADGLARIGLASAGMAAVAWLVLASLPRLNASLFTTDRIAGSFLLLVLAGGLASIVYFALVGWLGVSEVRLLGGIVRGKLTGRR
jgi:putative peptidoglycan lipid II flippase